ATHKLQLLGVRHQDQLDATVLCATAFRTVRSNRGGFTNTNHVGTYRLDTKTDQHIGHGLGAVLRQHQVVLVTAGTVGVAADLDHGGLVFLQYFRYGVEYRLEGFLDVRLVGIEGNVARHIENDVVSVTGHRYTG